MKYKTGDRFKANVTIVVNGWTLYTEGKVYAIKIIAGDSGQCYATRDDTDEWGYLTDSLIEDHFTKVDSYQNYDDAMGIL